MIKPSDIKTIKARFINIAQAEEQMDDAIRKAIMQRSAFASVEFTSRDVAKEIERRYCEAGWAHAIQVLDTGSDRAYSPRDGWTVRINLEGL